MNHLWISILHHHPISTTTMWQRLLRRFYTQGYHIHDDQRTIIDIHKSYIPYSPIPTSDHYFLIMLYNILNCSMIMEKMIESPFSHATYTFLPRFTSICDMLLYCIYSVVQTKKNNTSRRIYDPIARSTSTQWEAFDVLSLFILLMDCRIIFFPRLFKRFLVCNLILFPLLNIQNIQFFHLKIICTV